MHYPTLRWQGGFNPMTMHVPSKMVSLEKLVGAWSVGIKRLDESSGGGAFTSPSNVFLE